MRRLLFVIVALTALFASRLALAQSAEADYAESKRKGDEAMVALRYEEALGHYRKAYEASQNPALLYNMGRAYEGLAEFPKALEALEEFDKKAGADLKARVPRLEELLRDVRARVATLAISTPVEGAEIRLGERVLGQTRVGQTILTVNAGKQKLVITKEGYFPFEKVLTLEGGKLEPVDAPLASRTSAGVLRITSPVAGAAVSVDGKAIGIVPAESVVPPGTHAIGLRREGYDPAETSVVLSAGERKDVDVPMAKSATIFSKWWFWTAVGVVVASGVATTIALTSERSADSGTIPPGQVKAELRF